MDEATRFLLNDLLTREPGLSSVEVSQRLRELDIHLPVWQVKAALEAMPNASKRRRDDSRFGWKVTVAESAGEVEQHPEPPPEIRYLGHPLRAWQQQALLRWHAAGDRGVIEAITGTGKTLVGVTAIRQTVQEGGRALLLVPTLALKDQWVRELQRNLPDVRVAQLGDGEKGSFRDADVLLSTVHSAAASRPVPPGLGLVVADEVHRYGAEGFATALSPRFDRRLGLTGTYERNDDGVALVLDPYFGGVVYGYQYAQAIDDGVVAPFHLALVATRFTDAEGREYARAEKLCQDARDLLIREYGYPVEWPFFFELVQDDARSRDWDEARACSAYLKGFAERRRLMAEASGKMKALSRVAPVLAGLGRALVFTETVEAALDAAERLGEFTEARAISGSSTRTERSDTLAAFRSGRVRVLCAPRILDEGIDVPEADLAIVVAASRTRRQMVQRMGRVIRLKDDGRAARIVILYVEGTPEDPATGGHEAFLDQVLDHAQSSSRIDGSDPSAMATWLRLD